MSNSIFYLLHIFEIGVNWTEMSFFFNFDKDPLFGVGGGTTLTNQAVPKKNYNHTLQKTD